MSDSKAADEKQPDAAPKKNEVAKTEKPKSETPAEKPKDDKQPATPKPQPPASKDSAPIATPPPVTVNNVTVAVASADAVALSETVTPETEVKDQPAAEAKDGEQTQETLGKEVESGGPYSAQISILRAIMVKRRVVTTSGNLPLDIARMWWLNESKIVAARGPHRRERYPLRPTFGISLNLYNYEDPNNVGYDPLHVRPIAPTYTQLYWNAVTSSTIPAYPIGWQAWIVTAHTDGDDQLKMIAPLSRMRGDYYEGQTALRLAEAELTAEMELGFSPLLVQIKVLGYLYSLTAPADSGLMSVASIPADSPLGWFGDYNPFSIHNAPALPVINAWFVTLKTFTRALVGALPFPAGWTPADIGTTVVIVPAPVSWLHEGDVLLWWLISLLEYPVRKIRRRGTVRDPNGNLQGQVGGVWVDFDNRWEAMTGLVHLSGPDVFNNVAVIFVQLEDFDHGAGRSIQLGGAPPLPMSADFVGLGVDIAPALTNSLNQQLVSTVPSLVALQRAQAKYYGTERTAADALSFWQSHVGVMNLASEFSQGLQHPTTWGPGFIEARAWTPAGSVAPYRAFDMNKIYLVPVNGSAMYPAITVANDGVVAGDRNVVHWELPQFNMTVSVAMAAGVLVYLTGINKTTQVEYIFPPNQLVPTIMSGGEAWVGITELMLLMAGAPRSLFWYCTHQAMPAQHAQNLTLYRDDFWGRRGDVMREGQSTFGSGLSQLLTAGRFLCHVPSNGHTFVWLALSLQLLSPNVLAARMDFASINRLVECFTLCDNKVLDLTWLKTQLVERPADQSRDSCFDVFDVTSGGEETSQAVHLATQLEGIALGGRSSAVGQTFRVARVAALQAQHDIFWNIFLPTCWGPCYSAGDRAIVDSDVTLAYTAVEGGSWVVTGGRPFPSYNPLVKEDLKMICRNNVILRTKAPEDWKARYYQDPNQDEWSRYAPINPEAYRRRVNVRI